jgi:hypothetical protein
MLVLATGLLATALLASNGYVHRPAVRLHQSLRCLADSEPAASDSAGNGDDADGLTMGDLLAAIASRQQGALPLEDLVDETRGSIDAMLEFGSDELDEIAYELAADLRSVQRNASSTAAERRIEALQAVLQRFDRSAAAVQREFDMGRSEIAAVRLKLDDLRAERAAAQEAELRSRGTARGRGWYGDAAFRPVSRPHNARNRRCYARRNSRPRPSGCLGCSGCSRSRSDRAPCPSWAVSRGAPA